MYYDHFLIDDIPSIQRNIHIESTNDIIKNTFTLFLSENQLELISNFSFFKNLIISCFTQKSTVNFDYNDEFSYFKADR